MNKKIAAVLTALALAAVYPFSAPAMTLPDEAEQVAVMVAHRDLWDWSWMAENGRCIVGFSAADLDHDGQMELIATWRDNETEQGDAHVWEVDADREGLTRAGPNWTRDQYYGDWIPNQDQPCYVVGGIYWYVFDQSYLSEEDSSSGSRLAGYGQYGLSLQPDDLLWVVPLGHVDIHYDDGGHRAESYEDGFGGSLTEEEYYHGRLERHFPGGRKYCAHFHFHTYGAYDLDQWKFMDEETLRKKLLDTFHAFSVEEE